MKFFFNLEEYIGSILTYLSVFIVGISNIVMYLSCGIKVWYDFKADNVEKMSIYAVLFTMYIYSMLTSMSFLMMVGKVKSEHLLMIPWMVFSAASTIIYSSINMIRSFSLCFEDLPAGVVNILSTVLFFVVQWGFISGVHMHYQELVKIRRDYLEFLQFKFKTGLNDMTCRYKQDILFKEELLRKKQLEKEKELEREKELQIKEKI